MKIGALLVSIALVGVAVAAPASSASPRSHYFEGTSVIATLPHGWYQCTDADFRGTIVKGHKCTSPSALQKAPYISIWAGAAAHGKTPCVLNQFTNGYPHHSIPIPRPVRKAFRPPGYSGLSDVAGPIPDDTSPGKTLTHLTAFCVRLPKVATLNAQLSAKRHSSVRAASKTFWSVVKSMQFNQ